MARARNIKPGFFTNDVLAELPPLARLLFAGLWTLCDRAGRAEDRPKRIKAEVLAYDDCDCDALLQALHDKGFIRRYEVNGTRLIQVLTWDKHQNPHVKEAASLLPAPAQHQSSTGQEQCSPQPLPERAGLIPDSLIPDSLIPEKKTVAPPRQSASPPSPPPPFDGLNAEALNGKSVVELASTWELPDDWGEDAEKLGWQPSEVLREAEKFRQYWVAGKGMGKRRNVKGWRQSWSNWLAKAAENRR